MALIHWVLRLCCLSAIPVPTSSPHVLSDTDPCSLFFRLVKLPSTLPNIPVYKYKINLFTLYDICLQLKNLILEILQDNLHLLLINYERFKLARITITDKKIENYLHSRPTAEIAIVEVRVTRTRADQNLWYYWSQNHSPDHEQVCIPRDHCSTISWLQERLKCRVPIALAAAQCCLGTHCWGTCT